MATTQHVPTITTRCGAAIALNMDVPAIRQAVMSAGCPRPNECVMHTLGRLSEVDAT